MKIKILTLFEYFFHSPMSVGVINTAIENKNIEIEIIDLRKYGEGNYKKCDDTPSGGGPGMVMTASIFKKYFDSVRDNSNKKNHTILFSPAAKVLTQAKVKELAKKEELTLILGHYEGIDKRVEDLYVDETLSIGDYVLSGGEIASLVLIDSIARYKGALGNEESILHDTFEINTYGMLEYDQYTRPREIEHISIPEVLQNGNHKEIDNYRHNNSLVKTFTLRPDIFLNLAITKRDIKVIFDYLKNKKY